MKIICCKNYEEMSAKAADVMASLITLKPNCVLGLATGSSPLGLYSELANRCAKGSISFENVRTVNLDEYCGLDAKNDQSYAYFMNKNLFSKVNIKPENTNLPNGTNTDAEGETARYDALIASMGGIDMQLLGIGVDGHIGFNEPADHFSSGTIKVELDPSTIEANARFFESADDVPRYAYSMGCREIINAKTILFIANGKNKAEILEKAFFGPITPEVPASILQLVPDKVYAFCDAEAGAIIAKNHPESVICL